MSEDKKQPSFNAYVCPLGHRNVFVHAHFGTTPMIIECPDCRQNKTGFQYAKSEWYKMAQDGSEQPNFEWYRPTDPKKVKTYEREHVRLGGCLIRACYEPGTPLWSIELNSWVQFVSYLPDQVLRCEITDGVMVDLERKNLRKRKPA